LQTEPMKKTQTQRLAHSLTDRRTAFNRLLEETNANPKPIVWTSDPNRVIALGKRWRANAFWAPCKALFFLSDGHTERLSGAKLGVLSWGGKGAGKNVVRLVGRATFRSFG
jgi:hypothetical protein